MAVHKVTPSNGFVRAMRKIYNPLGFKKGYNFTLFFIFGGALLAFALARIQFLSIQWSFRPAAAPGEFYWYNSKRVYLIGVTLHLCCVLPAGILVILQFIPIIRYKLLTLHRINGYLCILLLLCGNGGALMIARHAFGGTLATQAGVGALAIATTLSLCLAYYNIKRLQIEQHRAWMLRAWSYAGTIITMRLIFFSASWIITHMSDYVLAVPCRQLAFVIEPRGSVVPQICRDNMNVHTTVKADMTDPSGAGMMAAFDMTFGMALWIAFALHAIGVEMYLAFTPAETERLRRVSYQRQLERGFERPGSAGLTIDRFGDCEDWKPPAEDREPEQVTLMTFENVPKR